MLVTRRALPGKMPRHRNVPAGALVGLLFGLVYSVIAVVLFLARGQGAFEYQAGVSLLILMGVYMVGGVLGGAVVGLLLPWTNNRWGAVVVGMIAAVPVVTGVAIAMDGMPSGWSDASLGSLILTSVLLGGAGGYMFWTPPSERN